MSEIGEIESVPTTEEKKKQTLGSGLGAALRNEREKKGLTLDQVVSITKLRRPMVEALEGEIWENLPPPVFTRGFIRTYAGVLGLDAKHLLDLYAQVTPLQAVALTSAKSLRRPYKKWIILAVIVALIISGLSFFLLREPPPSREASPPQKEETGLKGGDEKKGMAAKADLVRTKGEEGTLSGEKNAGSSEALPPVETGQSTAGEERTTTDATAMDAAAVEKPGGPQQEIASSEVQVLRGIVSEATWVRISIDNGEPKEYLFQPGARPQWKAKEGFSLMVGNAGGIELELNGRKLASLGKPGKVAKLKLPESFKPTREGD